MALSPEAEQATPETTDEPAGGESVPTVDPRAPRFGQAITALGLGSAVAFDLPVVLYATAAVLVVPVASGWRIDPYAVLWRTAVLPVLGRPEEREPAAPHRFARVLGAIGAGLASALALAGAPTAAYAVAGGVALLAALAASTGTCLGCRMYRQVSFFRRLNLV